jgi:acetoin utilization deacetylase AcuC-like enzyme
VRVAWYDHSIFREHDSGPAHPERPERLDAAVRGLREAGLLDRIESREPREATREELLLVHAPAYVDAVAATEGHTVRFDLDTQASPRTYRAALRAAGAVVQATEALLDGEVDRAFCAVRPPGHHAEADRAMGFSFFNTVAVAAAVALGRGLRRVAIVDFDVHHGNGSQHRFEDDPRVLYLSSHEYPFYPGTGALDEQGRGAGWGFTVNLPMPSGLGDRAYARVYREIALPIVRAYDPELVLVSVGFDPYREDPLAGMDVTETGFAELTAICLEMAAGAAGGKAVFVLEGGYALEGIARSAAAVVSVLLDDPRPPLALGAPGSLERQLLTVYRDSHQGFWPVLRTAQEA